jgi:membrane-associated phospholipid phosphatase
MSALNRWLIAFAATAAVVVVCYFWVDRQVALLAHAHTGERETFARFTHIPDPLIPAASALFIFCGLWVFAGKPASRFITAVALASISLIVSETIKSGLKFVFGRLWPDTWVQNNPSFIHDGAYGFYFFHGGPGYASFPSGHTTVTCALISVLWILYPYWRPFYAAIVAAVVVGLIGANYHYVSDVIAGGFLGTSTGWMTVALWRAPGRTVAAQADSPSD